MREQSNRKEGTDMSHANKRVVPVLKGRKKKKAENQAFVDADGNKGQKSDSDIHHTKSGTQVRTSIAYNRATHTRGEVKS